jgi:hypothetical protein
MKVGYLNYFITCDWQVDYQVRISKQIFRYLLCEHMCVVIRRCTNAYLAWRGAYSTADRWADHSDV